eukprot:TRINITY_DN11471_c0_g1_i2.p1 TRINITY_DN11471_c0_g1~~TRINITY_DN11471_c0_g1_i2.p1  ORF type:complete len:183 (+),score=33.14 TRINITY_DN11471_c0_g1_i2:408-956(+)
MEHRPTLEIRQTQFQTGYLRFYRTRFKFQFLELAGHIAIEQKFRKRVAFFDQYFYTFDSFFHLDSFLFITFLKDGQKLKLSRHRKVLRTDKPHQQEVASQQVRQSFDKFDQIDRRCPDTQIQRIPSQLDHHLVLNRPRMQLLPQSPTNNSQKALEDQINQRGSWQKWIRQRESHKLALQYFC